MTALQLVFTNGGMAALVDPDVGGTRAVLVTEVGFTDQDIVPAPTLDTLPGEFKRLSTISGTAADSSTVHLTIRDSDDDIYTVRAIGLYLDDGTLFAVYAQEDPILQKAEVLSVFMAIDFKVTAGIADDINFPDANFLNPPATEIEKGVAYLATIAEALAGAVADKIITPATMKTVLDNYVAADKLGAPYGVATLGVDGKLVLSQRPPIDLIDVWPVANQAAMLALAATVGDFAVRADNGLVYVLQAAPATTLGNWLEISTPAPVSSVNGKVGTVVLTPGDIGSPPNARRIDVAGGLLTGGGDMSADRVISLLAANAAEALAAALGNKVVTPAALASIVAAINAKAQGDATVTGGGILGGQGGPLAGNPVLNLSEASPSEIVAGALSNKAVTPFGLAHLPQSLTPNGYMTFPGGFLIQWVQVRQTYTSEQLIYVNFPIAFQAIVLPIFALGHSAEFSTVRDLWPQRVGEPDLGGCNIGLQSDDGRDMRLDGFDLIVIGK